MVTVRYDHILYDHSSGQAANNTSYVVPVNARAIQYNSGDYVSPTIYLDYLMKCVQAVNNHGWIGLIDLGTSDTPATGTTEVEYEVTSTTVTWYRSSAITTLTDGNRYCINHKNESTASTTVCLYAARLVIIDEIGSYYPTSTFSNYCLGEILTTPDSTTSSSYDRPANSGVFLYTSTDYAVTPEIYFEANLSSSSASYYAYAILYDVTSSATVTGTEISTNVVATTTFGTRVRTDNITDHLTSGHYYSFSIKRGTGGTCYSWNEFIIVKQTSGSISKCRFFHAIGGSPTGRNATSYLARYSPGWSHATADWGISPTWKGEYCLHVSGSSTNTTGICTMNTTTELTNSTTTGTDVSAGISVWKETANSFSPADGTAYTVNWKNSGTTYYSYCKGANLRYDVTFTAAPTGFKHSFAIFMG